MRRSVGFVECINIVRERGIGEVSQHLEVSADSRITADIVDNVGYYSHIGGGKRLAK